MNILEERIKRIVRECINEFVERDTNAEKLTKQAKSVAKTYIDGLPITYGWEYVPKEKGVESPQLQKSVNEFVLCFKNDNDKFPSNKYQAVKAKAINYYNSTLVKCFGDDIGSITLMGVPCHDKKSNELRWRNVLSQLCSNRMGNGYDHIKYKEETLPSHLNKGHIGGIPDVEYDKAFFDGRTVVLIDDLYTTGTHIKKCREELESCGSKVILAITLAKTEHK
jgi:hypothetical protein